MMIIKYIYAITYIVQNHDNFGLYYYITIWQKINIFYNKYIGIRMRYKTPNKATFEHLSHDFNCKNVQFIFSTDYR